MEKKITRILGMFGLVVLGLAASPKSYADDGVIIYQAESHKKRFSVAKNAAKKYNYSYTQQAYQGTLIYYGEGTNLDPDVYSSRAVSFYVTFANPRVIHVGHRYGDPDAKSRDTRILPRRTLR